MKDPLLEKSLEQVKEFHKTFGHPVRTKPTLIPAERANLRVALIQEELDELKEAIFNEDIVGIADALTDLQYVLNGAYHEFGLANLKALLFLEVHNSNMSKLCNNVYEAQDYIDNTTTEDGPTAEYEVLDNGKAVLYSTEPHNQGKILKSPHYFKPNLKIFLKNE